MRSAVRAGDVELPRGAPRLSDAERAALARWVEELLPEALTRRRVSLQALSRRPTCVLYRLHVHDSRAPAEVIVKVRHARPGGRAGAVSGRPSLTSGAPLGPEEAARREFEGLVLLQRVFGSVPSDRFTAVRPLGCSGREPVLAMEYVDDPTLRTRLHAQHRLKARDRPLAPARELPWRRAGEWLRRFQQADGGGVPVEGERLLTTAELTNHIARFVEYLTRHGMPSRAGRRVEAVTTSVHGSLPARLPSARGHGDFSPRNVFVDGGARVAVFDPMIRWRVPVYEDAAVFLHHVRLAGLQRASGGVAIAAALLDRLEAAFQEGYGRDGDDDSAAFLLCRVLVLLDHWAGLASAPIDRSGAQAGPSRLLRTWMSRPYVRELERLLHLVEAHR